eukprot:TRINITY_DN5081_c0_g1_i2.p1 TRINITY_DN5081_c0_g1~~TRINITY_DN5081_c0_g1_i2.p1  ORF type:complete len:315 (+),score=87.37 TRINITY_DN5081_c0_g1_i2:132-1076(+)
MNPAGVLFLLCLAFCWVPFGIHKVEEGHVGVYWRGGALIDRVTEAGLHVKIPFLETFENVQVTLQTDKVTDIPCGTSGGVMIWIEKVEVVNRLSRAHVWETVKNYTVHYDKVWIFDKIHHEINQFCSKHTLQEVYIDLFHTVDDRLQQALQEDCDKRAPGIEIIAIRITKPKIPASISKNYESMEIEKVKLQIAKEAQKVVEQEAETERRRAIIESEKIAQVSEIRMKQKVAEQESMKLMKEIEDAAHVSHEKAVADAHYYRLTREADANTAKLTPEFLQLQMVQSLTNNTKIYFGPDISSMYLDFFDKLGGKK